MKKAFTLVEMLLAVCILSIGIVMVLRSFLTAYDALDSMQTRLRAVEFLQEEMSNLETQAKTDGGITVDIAGEREASLGKRKAVYKSEIAPEPEEEFDDATKKLSYRQVTLSLRWQESGRMKESVLAAYMVVIEKEDDE